MKPEEYPVEPPRGIFHFPQGVMCLVKKEDTGKESVKITRISGDEFEFEITPKQLSVAEQKDFPIRVCEYEKLIEEEEPKEKPTEIIKSEKKIDITLDNKCRQVIADGEILKVGNTITYTAGTNLITLDDSAGAGDSWGTAYDMDDVVTNCGAVVTKQGENAYDVSARMKFESGVYFVSKDEFVELRPNPANPSYTIRTEVGSHLKFGDYNSSDKYSYNGAFWRIYVNANSGSQTNRINGELLVYGSNIWTDTGSYPKGIHFVAGAKIRLYSSIHEHPSYFWAEDCDVQDVKWLGTGGSYDMLVASAPDFSWGKLTTMGCQKGIFFSSTTTGSVDVYDFAPLNAGTDVYVSTGIGSDHLVRIINSPLAITCSNPGSGKQGVQFCYTFNVKVTNSNGDGIIGATVSLKDVDGADAFTPVDTIAGGVLPNDEIIKWYWFRHANDGGNKDYNDHTLKVVKCADEVEYKIKIDHQIKEDVVLIPSPTASYDNIMAGITDIKGTDFVKDTHSLKPILDDVTGLNGSVMIGTNNANTTTPPTVGEIKTELEDTGTKLTLVKTATDKLQFAAGNDIKATLDNEEVTTDTASRTASKATGFATSTDQTYLLKIVNNKKELKKNGDVWELIIYDDDGIASILNKVLKDSTGANITDLAAGALAAELANSV